jgi:phosphate starvation-inducible protein PhoH and related proteins
MATKVTRKRKAMVVDTEIEESLQANWTLSNFKVKKPFHFNEKHKAVYDCIKHDSTNMVIVDGPAGSAKSYIGVLGALELLQERQVKNIIYIRSVVESASRSIGALPGEVDDKFMPYAMPLLEKVQEITDDTTCAFLQSLGVLKAIPVNFVRGLTFNDSVVIVDEMQNLTMGEITTIITRFGKNTKYILCGDSFQADIGKMSCITRLINAFDTQQSKDMNIHCFKFGETEIVRSKILKYIVKVLERVNPH